MKLSNRLVASVFSAVLLTGIISLSGCVPVETVQRRMVTVSVPYNARAADVDNFRALLRGDPVRVEGEFVNPDNLQLLSFLSPRN